MVKIFLQNSMVKDDESNFPNPGSKSSPTVVLVVQSDNPSQLGLKPGY